MIPKTTLIPAPINTSRIKCKPQSTLVAPTMHAIHNVKTPNGIFTYKHAIPMINALAVCLLGQELPFECLVKGSIWYTSKGRGLSRRKRKIVTNIKSITGTAIKNTILVSLVNAKKGNKTYVNSHQ